jgi:hypothetical protein
MIKRKIIIDLQDIKKTGYSVYDQTYDNNRSAGIK